MNWFIYSLVSLLLWMIPALNPKFPVNPQNPKTLVIQDRTWVPYVLSKNYVLKGILLLLLLTRLERLES